MTTSTTINRAAVERVVAHLGAHTRSLHEQGDYDALHEWAVQMSDEYMGPAAASYYELAVLLGPPSEDGESDGD